MLTQTWFWRTLTNGGLGLGECHLAGRQGVGVDLGTLPVGLRAGSLGLGSLALHPVLVVVPTVSPSCAVHYGHAIHGHPPLWGEGHETKAMVTFP